MRDDGLGCRVCRVKARTHTRKGRGTSYVKAQCSVYYYNHNLSVTYARSYHLVGKSVYATDVKRLVGS